MTKIFENKDYPLIMYLLIVIMFILLFFNFVNIVESSDKKTEQEKRVEITAMTIFEQIEKNQPSFIFYSVLSGLVILIIIISKNLILTIKNRC